MILTKSQVAAIQKAAEDALIARLLSYDGTIRLRLARGIPPKFFLGFVVLGAPSLQLDYDLNTFNDVERLADGTVPLEIWLRNAIELVQPQKEVAVLQQALEQVTARVSGAPTPAIATAPVYPVGSLPSVLEKVIHRDDMLPYPFMAGAQRVGASVARLSVPEYLNGNVRLNNQGEPVIHLGTGWLVAPDLLMTNWHVVNAREAPNGPPPAASPIDLALQGAALVAQFDYDSEAVQGLSVKASKLEASDRNLDYALIRLASSVVGRQPLTLSLTPLKVQGVDDFVAVNIIQHPGGRPKRVAIRNNLVYETPNPLVRYFTDTEGGSSGSPVCTDDWRVVALHRAWKAIPTVQFQGRPTAVVNEGTQITAILGHLQQHAGTLHGAIVGAQPVGQ